MESELELVDYKNKTLNTELDDFDFSDPPEDPNDLAQRLVDFMREQDGIGLAANQIGLPYRVFVMEGEPAHACFNPRIVSSSEETVLLEEACLTFPGMYVKVKRPRDIRARFTGPDGEVYTKTFTGMSARVFQHELDHLDGITMLKRANLYHRQQAIKKWKKWKSGK